MSLWLDSHGSQFFLLNLAFYTNRMQAKRGIWDNEINEHLKWGSNSFQMREL